VPKMGQLGIATLERLLLEIQHESPIFPEDTDEVITLTAGGEVDTFSDWAEIAIDGNGTSFSSKVALVPAHISGILIEDLDTKDKRYLMEIAYGDDKTAVLRHRFVSGETKKLAAIQFMRIRSEEITAGETVYYRMKCETASATCEISLRYHPHP